MHLKGVRYNYCTPSETQSYLNLKAFFLYKNFLSCLWISRSMKFFKRLDN